MICFNTPQTAQRTLSQLHEIETTVNPWDLETYVAKAKHYQLNDIHWPFWHDWALSKLSKFFTLEPLHHWHKMFWDHDAQWCICAVGHVEIDYHFSILFPHSGFWHFSEGISKLKQVTGQEHCNIQHYICSCHHH